MNAGRRSCTLRDVAAPVFILGGAQTDFARSYAREAKGIGDIVRDTIDKTLTRLDLSAADIGTVHVANAFGELFNAQSHLGAMPATVVPAFAGIPASRHEAACASGGVALLAAMSEIEAGRYDSALVLGAEQERNVPGDTAAKLLAAAGWVGQDGDGHRYLWPHVFSRIGDEYARRYGLDHRHLASIAEKALTNARANPNAQTRSWTVDASSFAEDDAKNPVIEGRIRRQDCSQVTDGGAAIVVCSGAFRERYLAKRGMPRTRIAQILGWGHTTSALQVEPKLVASREDAYVLPDVRRAILGAFRRAGVGSVDELQGIETHDCFTVSEYMAIDHFGISLPGQQPRVIEDGTIARRGRIPVNPSGGLVGVGHPVGATGVRIVLDAAKQVTLGAEDYQVDGARVFGTLNLGGSAATVVSFVIGRAA
jgi:acetyl-CoA C-acetyltransferase